MRKNGITLVSLIITIVVILILSAVGITISVSLIGNTRRAAFLTKMNSIEEAVSLRIMANEIGLLSGEITNEEVFQTKMLAEELENLDDAVKYEILVGWQIASGQAPAQHLDEIEMDITDLTDYLFKLGEDITGDQSYASVYDSKVGAVYKINPVIINGKPLVGTGNTGMLAGKKKILKEDRDKEPIIVVGKGDYKKMNGQYVCEPDLTGFNILETYYVSYDENEEIVIENKIGKGAQPDNWYNYAEKKWANIVVNNNNTAYFVWIPRYVYKITYYTDSAKTILSENNEITQYGKVDVKFVNKENLYRASDGTRISYKDSTEYILPEAFTFAEKELAGFWMAKYEASAIKTEMELKIGNIRINPTETTLTVNIIGNISGRNVNKNDVYLDGIKVHSGPLPFTMENLKRETEYEVTIRTYIGSGASLTTTNAYVEKIVTRKPRNTTSIANAPDLTGFNPDETFYVTYDNDGNPIVGEKIGQSSPPENWYNYTEKKWANIVVNNANTAYFVWIPRYEYEEIPENVRSGVNGEYIVNVNFIPASQTTPTPGFIIPEAFTFAGKELAGFWMAKYEASATKSEMELKIGNIRINPTETTLTVSIIDNISGRDASKNDVYLNGNKVHSGGLPFTINNLSKDTEYEVAIRTYTGTGINSIPTNMYKEKIRTRKPNIVTTPNAPDLTGFNTDETFYVTYDNDGNPIVGEKIGQSSPPANWYDYANKKWANIVVNNMNTAYFVWIPRYEYEEIPENVKTKVNGEYKVNINFIPASKTTPTPGFIIPEAFTFAGKELAGFWMAKYEASSTKSEGEVKIGNIRINPTETTMTVNIIDNISGRDASKNEIYINGRKVYSGTLPCQINGLTKDTEYEVAVRAYTGSGINSIPTNMYKENVRTRKPRSTATPNAPNLTGFRTDTTYYISYDADGNEIKGNPISGAAPTNWYDYANKKWANIVVENNDKKAYWVWIPRYEYEEIPENLKIKVNGEYKVNIHFIPASKTTPTPGFIIPEAFTFAGKELEGFWMAKYEISI